MKVVLTIDVDPGTLDEPDPDFEEQVEASIVDAFYAPEMQDAVGEAIAESTGYVMEAVTVTDVKASRKARG